MIQIGSFSPIRVVGSYSKTMSIIYINYVNYKDMWPN